MKALGMKYLWKILGVGESKTVINDEVREPANSIKISADGGLNLLFRRQAATISRRVHIPWQQYLIYGK